KLERHLRVVTWAGCDRICTGWPSAARIRASRSRPMVVDLEKKREQMSVVELQELDEVKGLLAKGQQVGVLSYAEITKAMSELDLDESDVEELHGFLEKSEIELVEDIDPATAASVQLERAPDKRGRRKAKAQLDLKPDMTTDSLQLFLKDIGKVRLLTAQ